MNKTTISFLCLGGLLCVIATLVFVMAKRPLVASRDCVVMGDRTRGGLAEGTGRPGEHSALVPTPARSDYVVAPITIVVEPAAEASPETTEAAEQTQKLSAAVYGATWCGYCEPVKQLAERLRASGHSVEYRDMDARPSKYVSVAPTVFVYSDGQPIAKAEGVPACLQLLTEQFPK